MIETTMREKSMVMDHEKLDMYHIAVEIVDTHRINTHQNGSKNSLIG